MRNLVTEHESVLERVSPEIQISVFRTDILASVALVLNRERRGYRLVEDIDGAELYFNVACIHLRVLALALHNLALYLDDELPSERCCGAYEFFRSVGLDNELRDAVAVAEIDECHSAEFPGFLYPAGEYYLLAHIRDAELSTGVCSEKCVEHILGVYFNQ